jgi:hypothetical protein
MPKMILIFFEKQSVSDDKRFEVGLSRINPFQLLIK